MLRECDEFTHVVDSLALEAVVAAHRQVEALDRHRHFTGEHSLHRCGANFDSLGLLVEVASQTEELHQGATSGRNSVAGAHGGLGLDVDHKAVEVSTLTGTSCLDAVGDLEDGRVDRVDRNLTGFGVLVAVLNRGHISTATLDGELQLEACLVVQGGNVQLGVVDFHTGRSLNVSSADSTGTSLAKVRGDGLVVLAGDNEVLDVQDDLGDVFLHTGNSGELVQHAVDTDAGYGRAGDGGQQGTAQGVTERVSEARLQGLNHKG